MTVQELQDKIKQLTDTDFQQLSSWVVTEEKDRRAAQPAIEQAQADIFTELQDAGKLEKPEVATEEEAKTDAAKVPEWRDPGVDHSLMYCYGDVVRYQGKLVRSTHQGLNHWEPGTLAFDGRIWEVIGDATETPEDSETTEQPTAPAYRQPSGAHDAYKKGDRVTYNGAVYESAINGNVWAPDSYPQGWKKL
ncbi:hypothetical protein RAE03_10695 [Corynebacterium tuberculostearicum]|uniref:Chitin-binding type-3 domain-containing protein n=1 Tax=Corynebacterium tuberculostearicum TaxID=38304 RepID=A0AAE4SYB9_9CORY|nr:carbohydrate-binding protein [Corynebacterium tuberculostearicum]MDV2420231.1 hypothetical protein [Corynebacterium tuberculostearicum]